jgi:TRAP-type C4-dicarboxylate transport system permease small subunit
MAVLIKVLSRLNRWQLEVFRYSAMFMVVVIACVIAAGVFFRYVLNDSLSWSEELAKYAMLWMVFLGAPIALRTGGHPNIEILLNLVPRRFSILVKTIVYGGVLFFCGFLTLKSHDFAWNGRTQVAISIGDLSMYYIFVSIPVGMASMSLVSLQLFLEHVKEVLTSTPQREDQLKTQYKAILDEF